MKFPLRSTVQIGRYVATQQRKGERYPLVLMLEPTLACNIACIGCGKIREYESNKARLSVDECIDAGVQCPAPVVSICGGEPLVFKGIEDVVEGFLELKKNIDLCTNALKLEEYLDVFTPDPRLTFVVHLDGMREIHDYICDYPGLWDVAVENIQKARARGFRVTTNTTIFNDARADDVQRLVTIKRSNLDGCNTLNLTAFPQELVTESPATHCLLKVKPEQRNLFSYRATVSNELRIRGASECRETQQSDIEACLTSKLCFGKGLLGWPANACNFDQTFAASIFKRLCFRNRQTQYRFVQTDLRVANRKLRGVDTDRNSSRSSRVVIPCERPLTAFIQLSVSSQRQRMGRNHQPLAQRIADPLRRQRIVRHASIPPVAHLEMGWFREQSATALDPMSRPTQDILQRRRRGTEERAGLCRIAEQRRLCFGAGKPDGFSQQLTKPQCQSAHRQNGRPGQIQHLRRSLRQGQGTQDQLVGIALPDAVDIACRDVHGFTRLLSETAARMNFGGAAQ